MKTKAMIIGAIFLLLLSVVKDDLAERGFCILVGIALFIGVIENKKSTNGADN
jgi:hypothetical protein